MALAGTRSAEGGVIKPTRFPREVRVESETLDRIHSETPEGMVTQILQRMQEVAAVEPDIICLPELFNTAHSTLKTPLSKVAETTAEPTTERLAAFAKKYQCYIVAPMAVVADGLFLQ